MLKCLVGPSFLSTRSDNGCDTLAKNDFTLILPIVLLAVGSMYLLSQLIYMLVLRSRYINFNNIFRLLIALFTFLFILPYVACRNDKFKNLLKGRITFLLTCPSVQCFWSGAPQEDVE